MKEALKKEEILFLDDKYKKDKIPKMNRELKLSKLIWNIKSNSKKPEIIEDHLNLF